MAELLVWHGVRKGNGQANRQVVLSGLEGLKLVPNPAGDVKATPLLRSSHVIYAVSSCGGPGRGPSPMLAGVYGRLGSRQEGSNLQQKIMTVFTFRALFLCPCFSNGLGAYRSQVRIGVHEDNILGLPGSGTEPADLQKSLMTASPN